MKKISAILAIIGIISIISFFITPPLLAKIFLGLFSILIAVLLYITALIKDANIRKKLKASKTDDRIFYFDGGKEDTLFVYEDRVIISHEGAYNFLRMGIKGDKTIYYKNITSVQFKEVGTLTAGYIQFSINGGRENLGGLLSATSDENTVMISGGKNEEAKRIVAYINQKLSEINKMPIVGTNPISYADELKKYKALLDDGVITQEEFNIKKKQLLEK